MIKAYFRLIDLKMLIILGLVFLSSPLLCGINTYTICLIYSHFLTVYLNNIFLLFIYQYTYRLHQISNPFVIRTSQDSFYTLSYFFIVGFGFIYNIIIYIGYYFFFGAIPIEMMTSTIAFIISNMMISGIECSIVYLQLGRKKNFIYLALPIFINFLFHFLWIQYF